jgi:hypothetical protein
MSGVLGIAPGSHRVLGNLLTFFNQVKTFPTADVID